MESGFCSVNWKEKEKNKQTPMPTHANTMSCVIPPLSPAFDKKSQLYQTSQQTFIPYCFVFGFGMTLALINNNANLIVPYSNNVLFVLIQLKKNL